MADTTYSDRKKKFFELLNTVAYNPGALEQILAPFAEENTSLLKKAKAVFKGGRYMASPKKVGFVVDYYKFYKPEATQLLDIILGKVIQDPKDPKFKTNFFIELLADLDTLKFLKTKGDTLFVLFDKLAPYILSIVLKSIKNQPDTDGLKILLTQLEQNGFNEKYIHENMFPKLKSFFEEGLKDPTQGLDRANWLLSILTAPATPLSTNTFAFIKQIDSQLRTLLSEKAVLKLIVSLLSTKPRDNKALLKQVSTILNRPEWKAIFQGVPQFLNDNKTELENFVFSNWPNIQEKLNLPKELSSELIKELRALSIDLSTEVLPLIFKFAREGMHSDNHGAILAIVDKFNNRPKVLEAPEPLVGIGLNQPSEPLYALIVPQFLIALRKNGVDMNVILKGLSDNTNLLLKIAKSAAQMALASDLPEGVKPDMSETLPGLVKLGFEFAFNSKAPFIKALGSAHSEQLAKAIIETPILSQILAKWGIEAPLIMGTIPFFRKGASIVLSHKPEIEDIIHYYSNVSTPQTDLKLVQDVAAIVQDIGFDTTYLFDNKDRILTLVDRHFELLKEKIGIPHDFSKEFVKDTLNLGIDLSKELLPFVGDLTHAVLREENHPVIVNIIDNTRKFMKAQGSDNEPQAIDSLLDSIFALNDNQILLTKLPSVLNKHAEPLGRLIDQFLTQTEMGKKVYIKTSDFLTVGSRHLPQLKVIAELYRKQDKKWILKVGGLLFDRQVFALLFKTVMRFISYKLTQKKPSIKSLSEKLNLFLKENTGTKMMDVGYWLEKEAKKTGKLMTRNFKGLHFSDQSKQFFVGCIVKGFNFDKAKLRNFSFENSVIKNCSFKGVHFIGKPNFKGVTIDKASLETLQLAIKDYNLKNGNDPISEKEMPSLFKPS